MLYKIFREPIVAFKWLWQTLKIARQLYIIKQRKLT